MSYQRDPDAYTRGVGAVQAVDKIRARQRFANPRARAAALESMRRDALRAKLLRPALGAINTSRFSAASRMPVKTGGIDTPGTPGLNQPGSAGGGGTGIAVGSSINPVNPRAVSAISLTQPVAVTAAGSLVTVLPAPGRPWLPTDQTCSPTQTGVYPNCVDNTFGTSGGNSTTATTTTTTTTSDGTIIPTSSVGVASGGGTPTDPTAMPPGVSIDTTPIDTSSLDTSSSSPDYMKYLPYAAVGLGLFLYWRSTQKKGG